MRGGGGDRGGAANVTDGDGERGRAVTVGEAVAVVIDGLGVGVIGLEEDGEDGNGACTGDIGRMGKGKTTDDVGGGVDAGERIFFRTFRFALQRKRAVRSGPGMEC